LKIPAPYPRKRARLEIIPLIDIMFFLLATFIMVSLSMIQNKGLTVNLPGASAATVQAQNPSVTLSVSEAGRLYWNKEMIDPADLKTKLLELKASDPDPKVFIHADEKAAYGQVVEVLDAVKGAGIEKVALRTRAREPLTP
jgi:biopolymer transport protein ExbD